MAVKSPLDLSEPDCEEMHLRSICVYSRTEYASLFSWFDICKQQLKKGLVSFVMVPATANTFLWC